MSEPSETEFRRDADAGFSMVELLVYMVLSTLALAVVGSLMINGLRVQKSVQSIDTATSTASIISRSLEQGIGSASGFAVGTSASAGQILQARTASTTTAGVTTWQCVAWYYSATNSSLYRSTSTTGAVAAPASTAALSTWTLLGTGISVPSGQVAFTATTSSVLKISLTVVASGSKPVVISTSQQTTQSDDAGAPTTCF